MSKDICIQALLADVVERLRSRLDEIEEAIVTRLLDVDSASAWEGEDELRRGQRETIRACLEAALLVIEHEPDFEGMQIIPPAALIQARKVAQAGLTLTAVLRRYLDGYGLFWDFLLEEIHRAEMTEPERAALLRAASTRLSSAAAQVMPMVAATHAQETTRGMQSREERTSAIVQALLGGAPVDTSELDYDVDADHVGIIATGPNAMGTVQMLAMKLNRPLLRIPRCDGTVWAWLRGGDPLPSNLPSLGDVASSIRLAVGEPGAGRSGFRRTHRQAQAAMQVALNQRQLMTRYADVLLLVPAIQDAQAGDSLISIYLSPLEESPEKDPTLKETLQAYFEAERNTSATAARLKVDRRTATTRLRAVEDRLGFPIYTRHAELEIALRLDQLRRASRAGVN